mgnify:CR=1 FL=1|jgi:hypothetical protein
MNDVHEREIGRLGTEDQFPLSIVEAGSWCRDEREGVDVLMGLCMLRIAAHDVDCLSDVEAISWQDEEIDPAPRLRRPEEVGNGAETAGICGLGKTKRGDCCSMRGHLCSKVRGNPQTR